MMTGVKLGLVSFDVCSLFINVHIQEAVDVVCRCLQEDDSLEKRTILQPDSITELLKLCLKSTYFYFKGEFYEQREGAVIGSPVSFLHWMPACIR